MFNWWYVVLGVLLLIAWYVIWKIKHRYVGCGMVIDHFPDGKIFIPSRLIKSPAGRAGIANGAELIEYNGEKVQGLPVAEWKNIVARLGPKRVGDTLACVVRQNGEEKHVTMQAEMIQGPIPIYRTGGPPRDYNHDDRVRYGLAVCTRTGQFITTSRLSDSAIESVFR